MKYLEIYPKLLTFDGSVRDLGPVRYMIPEELSGVMEDGFRNLSAVMPGRFGPRLDLSCVVRDVASEPMPVPTMPVGENVSGDILT